jgi:hypothetical protein
MKRAPEFCRRAVCAAFLAALALTSARADGGQSKTYERTFPAPAATIKKILQQMQGSMAGHLPVLDGFVVVGEHPLDHYQRGYFQATVQVKPNAVEGSVVQVSAKVTAWYADPDHSRSGYQLLSSNGRIENDILDQLSEQLALANPSSNSPPAKSEHPNQASDSAPEAISAPTPRIPESPSIFSSSRSQSLSAQEKATTLASAAKPADRDETRLQAELEQLEDVLKNEAHPKNLAAVKKSGTAVVATPSLSAKPLFLASAHDEFEILNFNQDWVHVRISGLSRGWIWRNDLEMPGDIPDTQAGPAPPSAADLFRVVRDEIAPFPGDWAPLRGKTVKVISVQKVDETAQDGGPEMKLEIAKSLFDKHYADLTQKSTNLAGIVLIFDSSDGGMIAAPQTALEQWKAGTLSDAALWHSCFFDPPETFVAAGPSGSH